MLKNLYSLSLSLLSLSVTYLLIKSQNLSNETSDHHEKFFLAFNLQRYFGDPPPPHTSYKHFCGGCVRIFVRSFSLKKIFLSLIYFTRSNYLYISPPIPSYVDDALSKPPMSSSSCSRRCSSINRSVRFAPSANALFIRLFTCDIKE